MSPLPGVSWARARFAAEATSVAFADTTSRATRGSRERAENQRAPVEAVRLRFAQGDQQDLGKAAWRACMPPTLARTASSMHPCVEQRGTQREHTQAHMPILTFVSPHSTQHAARPPLQRFYFNSIPRCPPTQHKRKEVRRETQEKKKKKAKSGKKKKKKKEGVQKEIMMKPLHRRTRR